MDVPPTASATGIRERSPGHFELRAYNPPPEGRVTRTHTFTRADGTTKESESVRRKKLMPTGDRHRRRHVRGKVEPDRVRTLSELLDEWIDHGVTRGRSPNHHHG